MALHLKEYQKRFSGSFHFYGNASHAFYDILIWLQEKRPKLNPNVVLPVFIPAKLYRLVLAAGYEPRFYDITLDCGLNREQVLNQIDEQTQALFCIHYFGIPAPVQDFREVTRNNNVYLIEDCAHTINSRWKGRELGTIGDCALFSSRKMLQLPAGGLLAFNTQPWAFEPTYKKRVRSIYTACKGIRMRMKTLYFHLTGGYDPLNMAWIPRTGYINFSEEHRFNIKKMSWLNEIYTHLTDLDKIAGKRRENFEYVLNGIRDLSFLRPVGGLQENERFCKTASTLGLREGVTPYSFPVLVPPGTREIIRNRLRENGIGCGAGWPESPFGHTEFERATELSERLLELPIHQGMAKAQLRRMLQCLKDCDERIVGSKVNEDFNHKKSNSKLEVV